MLGSLTLPMAVQHDFYELVVLELLEAGERNMANTLLRDIHPLVRGILVRGRDHSERPRASQDVFMYG